MDKSVIKAAAKGDIHAFKKIFETYVPKFRGVCRRYCQRDVEVDDVLQEAFIKVFESLKTYKFKGSFEGWLRRIIIYTAINHFRKSSKISFLENEDLDKTGHSESPEKNSVVEDSTAIEIQKAVDKLPEGYRIVFNLYVLEDYSHKQIAELLEISEGTSRSQFSKAKKMIKNILEKQRFSKENTLI